jgi:hypothetical protein
MNDKPRARAALLDIWRCVNIVHACTYVLSDKARRVYTFETFVVAIAEAFGESDGVEAHPRRSRTLAWSPHASQSDWRRARRVARSCSLMA